ncbi:MAG: hypothetical protein HYZ52_04180 [Candidatus Omnitrophica bacterium]|nr:hypothetical protein [Candidatus Omnitrophota bacterium]
MKKIFWIFSVFLLILAAGAVFISTFRLDRLKPLFLKKIEEAVGRPVTIDHIRLSWRGGLGLGLENLAVPPVFRADRLSLLAKWSSLGKENIELESVYLENAALRGVERLDIALTGISWARSKTAPAASAKISDGRIFFENIRPPLEKLNGRIKIENDRAEVEDLSGAFARGSFLGSGSLDLGEPGGVHFQAKLDDLPLEALASSSTGRAVKGRLSVALEVEGAGPPAPGFLESLNGGGKLSLADFRIVRFNVLREVLSKLSAVPGVADALQNLPPSYAARLAENDTVFWPVEIPFVVRNGAIYFDNLQASTPDFWIYGRGILKPDGELNLTCVFRMGPGFSSLLIQNVPSVSLLSTADGFIEIPVMIYGPLAHPKVKVDRDYIVGRVVALKGRQLLSDLLLKKPGAADATEAGGSSSGVSSYKKLLKNFF